jgi:2-dehydro-3-deoxyphosphogluconate aldolase/(4S)-4-hydroxy-2-oxoglutarate aldolase
VPGVATPSEVHGATALGCRWLKAFPAVSLGPSWFSAVRGPFPDVRFVATGGITPATARSFLEAGAAAVGIGSAVANAATLGELAGT